MILVVDDFADAATAMVRLLQREGYWAESASGGPEALARIRAHPREQPLLVVLDEMMPDMTGVDVLRAIRNDETIAHTAVVFHTAGFNIEERAAALTLGALAWFLKGGTHGQDVLMLIRQIGHIYENGGGVKQNAASDAAKNPAPPVHEDHAADANR
jgi:CheY-like chemotaxis protein